MENKDFLVEKFFGNRVKIIFFGSIHQKNGKQVNKIKEILTSFKPNIVLVEGGFENATFSSEEEAINNGGESGYASFLAKSRGIIVKGNDPSSLSQINFLLKEYNRDFIFAYFVIRDLVYSERFEMIDVFIEDFKNITKWEGFDYSSEGLMENSRKILSKELKFITKSYFDPTLEISLFNEATKNYLDLEMII
jgi:predicted metallo-beta-lactamase superfamily hydrolase